MNISICISFGNNSTNEINFSCIANTAPVRQLLIDNLTRNGIEYRDNGASIYVNADEFLSTDEIAERALTGFTKVDYKGQDRFDYTGTITSFRYQDIIPLERDREYHKYKEEIEECDYSGKPDSEGIIISLQQLIDHLKENSEDTLKRHYDELNPTMRI